MREPYGISRVRSLNTILVVDDPPNICCVCEWMLANKGRSNMNQRTRLRSKSIDVEGIDEVHTYEDR